MPGQPTTVGANIGLDAMSGRATQTSRSTYLALLTSAPGDTTTMSSMSELTTPGSNGYARQSVTWAAPSGDPSSTSNTNALTFGPFSSDLAAVTHLALVSASTGTSGDLIWYWTLDTSRDPANGDEIRFNIGALVMTSD
jgi:hypothetical protein